MMERWVKACELHYRAGLMGRPEDDMEVWVNVAIAKRIVATEKGGTGIHFQGTDLDEWLYYREPPSHFLPGGVA